MKVLHVAVHSHKGWGAEDWLAKAFERLGLDIVRYDFRASKRRFGGWLRVALDLRRLERVERPEIIFLQRAGKMPAWVLSKLKTPIMFWSTEPINRNHDVDQLLASNLFKHVWLHTYGCLDRVTEEFPHLLDRCSVIHNGFPAEVMDLHSPKTEWAIFNRNVSERRAVWLNQVKDMVKVVSGRYGKDYFDDLSSAAIALNVHFSDQSLDDFESGIFEAMAMGCVVVTERVGEKTASDLGMEKALVQVDSPEQMRAELIKLEANPDVVLELRRQSAEAIVKNTWDARALQFLSVFEKVRMEPSLVAGGV